MTHKVASLTLCVFDCTSEEKAREEFIKKLESGEWDVDSIDVEDCNCDE